MDHDEGTPYPTSQHQNDARANIRQRVPGSNIQEEVNPSRIRRRRKPRKQRPANTKFLYGAFCILLLGLVLVGVTLVSKTFETSRGRLGAPANKMVPKEDSPAVLLTANPEKVTVTSDVGGNLGEAPVILNNGTDWLHDRWQAASDMHGTAIHGAHWLQLVFAQPVDRISHMTLDWETAYAEDYQVQVLLEDKNEWATVYNHTDKEQRRQVCTIHESGKSPGVPKLKLPLHVVHSIHLTAAPGLSPEGFAPFKTIRIWMQRPGHAGWGVSLWRIELYGHFT